MIVVLQEWSIMIILNHWWWNQLQLYKYWDLHIAQLRVKVSQLLALFFYRALENKWRIFVGFPKILDFKEENLKLVDKMWTNFQNFQKCSDLKKKTWSLWTRSISMYDSSSETPESRSVAAVSDDDNFRFSSWRQFTILFSLVCSVLFSLKVSPVIAWWWSDSLWFPTYNALQPENEDNMSAEQGVCFTFLDFHWILLLQ